MHESASLKRPLAFEIQRIPRARTKDRDQKHSARLQDSAQLGEPGILHSLIQVSKYGQTVNHIEVPRRIWQRRLRRIGEETARLQMLITPLDRLGIHVYAMKFSPAVANEPCDCTAAAAPEIQHSTRIRKIQAHLSGALLYQIGAAFTNLEEPIYRK